MMIASADVSSNASLRMTLRTPVPFLTLALIVLFLLYFDTFASMVHIWSTIDTFTYGFLVFPISGYLIWQDRDSLKSIETSRSFIGLLGIGVFSALWWLSEVTGVQAATQYAVVAMIAASVLAIMGPTFTRAIAFPLGYLLLAVPFGEFLIPYLVNFTAVFAVETLHAVGIPVIRNGPFFEIPTGSYEVAKACSGIRFVIATIALSTLLSHSYFSSNGKRLAYVLFAFLLAVLANGIRATSVVLTLHHTDFDIAAAKDHAFVGWLVYGLLIIFLIAIGTKLQDNTAAERPPIAGRRHANGNALLFIVLALLAISIGPLLSLATRASQQTVASAEPRLPPAIQGWVADNVNGSKWLPAFIGYSGLKMGGFTHETGRVEIAIVRYTGQRQGMEVSNAANYVVDPNEWKIIEERNEILQIDGSETLPLREVSARRLGQGDSRLFWYWKEVNGTPVSGIWQTKLSEVRSAITFTRTNSSAIIVSAPVNVPPQASRELLEHFVRDYYEALKRCNRVDFERDECQPETLETGNN